MSRNPFDIEDVPEPDGEDVKSFATTVQLCGSGDDPNAANWADVPGEEHPSIEGRWSSRWNTHALDWRVGHGDLRFAQRRDRVFIVFDWDDGAKHGLIEARCDGERLVGRYLNLDVPAITRPWVGLIVDATRIDGEIPGGRIDFRRSGTRRKRDVENQHRT